MSSHELNQPGTYKDVKDTTIVAQFKVTRDESSEKLFAAGSDDCVFVPIDDVRICYFGICQLC